ncbi:MAG: hypothetical protein KY410_04010 [Proteobacteria bacterium]|nr:hypothetical protein [Pseudomonadota bacterium]
MAKQRSGRGGDMRRMLANEAARFIAEDGIRDYLLAKRKAALRFGVSERDAGFPTNQEIEDALSEYQRLFQAETQPQALRELREAARQAMRLFAEFEPRLVGPVLSGNATRHSIVQLHLFADASERVVMHLIDRDIPFEVQEKRLRLGSGQHQAFPAYRFVAGDVTIEAVVFPGTGIRQSPASPLDGKPMKRANLTEVERLLED